MSGGILVVTALRASATGILWAETKDSAKHPTMYRRAPGHKEVLVQTVNNAAVKKPWVNSLI